MIVEHRDGEQPAPFSGNWKKFRVAVERRGFRFYVAENSSAPAFSAAFLGAKKKYFYD